jgi:multiple sugar transport system permease protein
MLQTFRLQWRATWGSKLIRDEMLFGYAALIPYLSGFLIFVAGPLAYSLWLSFTTYNILQPPVPTGLDNYLSLLEDPLMWKSLGNTAIYSVVSVPLQVIIGYALALMLNQKVRGLSWWRTIYYVPAVVPVVASAYLFSYLFNVDTGLVNLLLKMVNIKGPNWFGSPTWALRTFIIMNLWVSGGGMIVYLAALQGVPTALYDAAEIDGANAWQRLWNITVPMTSPSLLFMFMIGIIGSFQVFTSVFIITSGGPVNATLMYVLYLYRHGWTYLQMGYASALAWVLFLIIFSLTYLSLKVSGRLVHYEI